MNIQPGRMVHVVMIMAALWKLNLLKAQMFLLEVMMRH